MRDIMNDEQQNTLASKLLNDENLKKISQNILPVETLMSYYRCAIMEVETKFKVLNEQFSLRYDKNPIETIKTREKSMNSIIKKLKKKNLPITLTSIEEEIHDVAGIRVICSFIDDVYLIADCFLKQDDIQVIEVKDYIKYPKPSGYRSLHLIIEIPIFLANEKKMMKVEVQLRTLAMDLWASQEHKLRYKKKIPPHMQDQIQQELYKVSQTLNDIDLHMEKMNKTMVDNQYHHLAEESKIHLKTYIDAQS